MEDHSTLEGKGYWLHRGLSDERRDWNKDSVDWVTDYKDSVNHPHRDSLANIVASLKPESVLEVGANCGPNLAKIKSVLPDIELSGIDLSADAIAHRGEFDIVFGDVCDIPFDDFDLVLVDAVLLYISPQFIKQAMDEITRVAQKYIVLVEWDSESMFGVEKNFHWARDYKTILEWYGFSVEKIKITQDIWPTSQSWVNNGYFYVATRKN